MVSEVLARSLAEGCSVYWKSLKLWSCFYIQVAKKTRHMGEVGEKALLFSLIQKNWVIPKANKI